LLRIISGEAKGRNIKTEPGSDLRPTLGRVKAALFSVIGDLILDAGTLDMFAGSGNLGLEAISRGADQVTFIESNQRRCDLIRRNLDHLGFTDRGRVVKADAVTFLDRNRSLGRQLILADPPYSSGWVDRLMRHMANNGILAPGGLLCLQHAPGELVGDLPTDLLRFRQKCYGDTMVTFLRKKRELEE
jgi:16S rRNA (guanine(966)-N(2))-methyltransferase RsmD